jgi:peptidoglycan/xylan/chitin deacetylase (PgdA/CDA1 family)
MAARAHPALVDNVVAAGHEIGSHGDQHIPVHTQTPEGFRADLAAARETIEKLTGRIPIGYRAPAFSITRDSAWAYDVLAEQGFAYDASQHDSPRLRDRETEVASEPHALPIGGDQSLWEFPVAVWRAPGVPVPVGGPSYWAVMPPSLVVRGLEHAGPLAGLYMHPHEFDPEPLGPELGGDAPAAQRVHASVRAFQRNTARWAGPRTLRAIASRFRLIPYGEAYGRLNNGAPARP